MSTSDSANAAHRSLVSRILARIPSNDTALTLQFAQADCSATALCTYTAQQNRAEQHVRVQNRAEQHLRVNEIVRSRGSVVGDKCCWKSMIDRERVRGGGASVRSVRVSIGRGARTLHYTADTHALLVVLTHAGCGADTMSFNSRLPRMHSVSRLVVHASQSQLIHCWSEGVVRLVWCAVLSAASSVKV